MTMIESETPSKGDRSLSYIPVYSSDEEDDSRDRQSHWKRIKTRSDDNCNSNGRSLIKWTDPREETSPVRRPLQAIRGRIPSPKKSSNPPGHRMIVLKSRLQGHDHVATHGGTNNTSAMEGQASKRKFEPMISMNIDMAMARRHITPVERGAGYEVRVREEGEVHEDDDRSLFLEDSSRPNNITVDLREALNRRTRENPKPQPEQRDFDVKVRVRRVDFDLSFQGSAAAAKKIPPPPSSGPSFSRIVSAATVSERDSEAERRRERWAEKERDLQKELQKQEAQKQLLLQQQSMAARPKTVTVVDYSHKFTVAKAPLGVPVKPVESDPHRLCQRQKQIDYGKNTLGYERYTEMVPRYQRTKAHPRTPDIRQVCSKRSWDGQIRKWRRLLHEYDPPKEDDDEDPDQMFVPTREHDGIMRGSAASDDCMMDVQAELVQDADLKIYDGWSDEEC